MNLSINFLMSRFFHEFLFGSSFFVARWILFALFSGLFFEIFAVKYIPFPAALRHLA